MKYRKYVQYYQFLTECKNHCVEVQSFELATNLRDIERTFFYKDGVKNLAVVSEWSFQPDIEFDEDGFIKSIQRLGKEFDIEWILRDFKLKTFLGI
jgi:hypothetical protein